MKVRQVRTALGTVSKFFSALGLRMDWQADPHVKTITADGRYIRYNQAWFDGLDFDYAVGILAQKTFQCAANHHIRMLGRDAELANIASQIVANIEILDAGYMLPETALIDQDMIARFKGMAFERVYNTLDAEREQSSPSQSDEGEPNGQQPPVDSTPMAGDDAYDPDRELLPQEPADEPMAGDAEGDGSAGDSDGSDGGGAPRPGDQDDYGGCGSIQQPRDPNGNRPSTSDLAQNQTEWEVAVREAEMVARRIGDLPGAAVTLSRQLDEGKVNWIDVVRRWLINVAANDYEWIPADRRFAYTGLYLPALQTQRLPRLVIGSDTSGSVMTERQIRIITDEINTLLAQVMPEQTTIIYWDTEIQAVDEYTNQDYPIELHLKGQGGTKCSPMFDWLEANDITPTCLLVFTDLEIDDFPYTDPSYPVLWCSTNGTEAPFGEVVMIDEV